MTQQSHHPLCLYMCACVCVCVRGYCEQIALIYKQNGPRSAEINGTQSSVCSGG